MLLPKLDLVLIMSVEPGFGGQLFMPEVVSKITELRTLFDKLISIDGGITAETAKIVRAAGVDVIVAGTAIFGERDRRKAIKALIS